MSINLFKISTTRGIVRTVCAPRGFSSLKISSACPRLWHPGNSLLQGRSFFNDKAVSVLRRTLSTSAKPATSEQIASLNKPLPSQYKWVGLGALWLTGVAVGGLFMYLQSVKADETFFLLLKKTFPKITEKEFAPLTSVTCYLIEINKETFAVYRSNSENLKEIVVQSFSEKGKDFSVHYSSSSPKGSIVVIQASLKKPS
jgi:hypothetical protein